MPCRHRDALGRPGEGFHRARIFGLAAWDMAATLAAACVVVLIVWAAALRGRRTGAALGISFGVLVGSFLGLWLLGTGLHWLFCVNTPIMRLLVWDGSSK